MADNTIMTRSESAYLYALSRIPGLGNIQLSRILLKYGSAQAIYEEQFTPTTDMDFKAAALVRSHATDQLLSEGLRVVDRTRELGGRIVSVLDDEYPLSLSQLASAPPVLYVIGELQQQDNYGVAVVGTRKASDVGKQAAEWIARELAKNQVTVVSGLALGIDTAAHTGALNGHGRTIAVIGTGIDYCYPRENKPLWDAIVAAGGAIMSEYAPGTPTEKWHFPERNKLMSGMAQGTVVVEAGETSGAKLQAQFAVEQGRVVFLMKRQVEQFAWAKALARKGRAVVVESVDDVMDRLSTLDDLVRTPEQLTFVWQLV